MDKAVTGAVFVLCCSIMQLSDCFLFASPSSASAQWLPWESWTTAGNNNVCEYLRNRNCSTYVIADCPGKHSENKAFSKPCKDVTAVDIHSTSLDPYWLPWGEWQYIESEMNSSCYFQRNRHCSSGILTDCTGKEHETRAFHTSCRNLPHWMEWNPWICLTPNDQDCVALRQRVCSTQVKTDCFTGKSFDMKVPCTKELCKVPFWESWSHWRCVHKADACMMLRTRNCSTNPADCTGNSTQTKSTCDQAICPAAFWKEWSDWNCTTAKNQCWMERDRNCSSGKQSDCSGLDYQLEQCDNITCFAGPHWMPWRSWSCDQDTDDDPCTMHRSRNCSTNTLADCQGNHVEKSSCDSKICPVFSEWSEWTCLSRNGICVQERLRNCSTGTAGDCVGKASQEETCTIKCPGTTLLQMSTAAHSNQSLTTKINPAMSFTHTQTSTQTTFTSKVNAATSSTTTSTQHAAWSPWFYVNCSATCGVGIRMGFRHCSTGNDSDCSGPAFQQELCSNSPCQNAAWSPWYDTPCSVSCGNGTRMSYRHCSSGTKSDCPGQSFRHEACMVQECTVWSNWVVGMCSVTCGRGTVTSHRTCNSRNDSDCSGAATNTEDCQLPIKCPEWSSWFHGDCSVTCGNGTRLEFRHCSSGKDTDCTGEPSKQELCMMQKCPDPEWSNWFKGPCSVTCGTGILTQIRHCSSGKDADCAGSPTQNVPCDQGPCHGWSQWFHGNCSVTCGNGTLMAIRHCSSGKDSDCPGPALQQQPCSRSPCQAADWSSWFDA